MSYSISLIVYIYIYICSISFIVYMYRLNTENGGFTPDKSRGAKAPEGRRPPRDLSGVKPTFEVFNLYIYIMKLIV